MKFLLVLVFVLNGEVKLQTYQFAEFIACENSRESLSNSFTLYAKCKPVDVMWGLK